MKYAMSLTILALTALMAGPALAQTDPNTGARPGNVIGTGNSLPTSTKASNISSSDTGSTIAPRLPDPGVNDADHPKAFLISAHRSLAAGHTGEAQEALERAETRYLDRSVEMSATDKPSANPMITQIDAALKAIAAKDRKGALRIIQAAIEQAS